MNTLIVLMVLVGLLLLNLAINIVTDWICISGMKSKVNVAINRATLHLHDPLKASCIATVGVGLVQLAVWLN